jgi:magnesium transporter
MVSEQHQQNLIQTVEELVRANDLASAVALFAVRHPADQADLIEGLDADARERLLASLGPNELAPILEYLSEDLRRDLLAQLPAATIAPALDQIDDDVAADIVQDLTEAQAEQVLPLLEDREAVQTLLAYPEESAGGRMSPDVVAIGRDWTVDEAIAFLRRQRPDAEQPFYLYVVDEAARLTGTVSLRALITAAPPTRISAILAEEPISVLASEDQEVAAERMRHYNLMALPVVDDGERLLGVITADNVLDVQVEEATEDIYRMAGVGVKEWAFSPAWESARRRIPWLSFNMAWAFAGAAVISAFEGTIEKVAALAIFMPMIAGQAGNSGIQTATIVVRSMALGEVQPGDLFRLLRKEWALGLIKGTIFGCVLGAIAWLWKDNVTLGLVAGLSMFLNMFVASTTGVVLPLTLRRLGIDPAAIAGVFDTMITDLMGFLIFLGLATLLISRLT